MDAFWGDVPALLTATAALIGVLVQGRKTRTDVQNVAKQMQPNGGSSFRDALDRVAAEVQEIRKEMLNDRQRVDDGLREHTTFREQITEALHLHRKCK